MSFLADLRGEPPDRIPPRRVYARVDRIEAGPRIPGVPAPTDLRSPFWGGETAVLDSVDANWFDETSADRVSLSDPALVDDSDRNVSAIEIERSSLPTREAQEGAWFELTLEPTGAGALVLHYLNLYAAPLEQRLVSARALGPRDAALAERTSMDALPDAHLDEIARALPDVAPEGAAVYDVGHGNACALLNEGFPVVYFDFGGGVLANRKTFPSALRTFCFTQRPVMVLSHWDWDHWSSANRDDRAYDRTWILPRQGGKLGPVHATFLGRILQRGQALVWPHGLDRLQAGAYELLRCTGPRSRRNDSGLALTLSDGVSGSGGRMLFPGDCRYDFVPDAEERELTSLVVAHHGGRTRSTFVPNSDGSECGRLVYSYGEPNSYGHPFQNVRDEHARYWDRSLQTADRGPDDLGHVHLYWDSTTADADPPCRGSCCQLPCVQR